MDAIEAFIRYLQYEKRVSPHTLKAYKNDLANFCDFYEQLTGTRTCEKAEYQHLRAWAVRLMQKEKQKDTQAARRRYKDRTVNRKIAALKTFFRFLTAQQMIKSNPSLRLRSLKTTAPIPEFLHEKEADQVLEAERFSDDLTGWRDRTVLELLYCTGVRVGELVSLHLSDLDVNGGTLRVKGKGGKERVLPISQRLSLLLARYVQLRNENTQPSCTHLIVSNKGEKPYAKLIYRIVQEHLNGSQSVKRKSPHIVRHTFASHLLHEGADLNDIKELLGHASLAATQIYTHHELSRIKKIYQKAHPKS